MSGLIQQMYSNPLSGAYTVLHVLVSLKARKTKKKLGKNCKLPIAAKIEYWSLTIIKYKTHKTFKIIKKLPVSISITRYFFEAAI